MLEIINGVNISYTQGDTFRLKISSGNGFNEGSKVRLVVARDETGSAVISNAYDIGADGAFMWCSARRTRQSLRWVTICISWCFLLPTAVL